MIRRITTQRTGKVVRIFLLLLMSVTANADSKNPTLSLDEAVRSLIAVEEFLPLEENDEINEWFVSKLLVLDQYDRVQVQEQILRLAIEIQIRDRHMDFWEGNPFVVMLIHFHSILLCGERDFLLSTEGLVDINDAEWEKQITELRGNPSGYMEQAEPTRTEFLSYIERTGSINRFKGNLFACTGDSASISQPDLESGED